MIIDRSKSQQEIDTQVDRLADDFQKTVSPEGIHELEGWGNINDDGSGEVFQGGEKQDRHIPQVRGRGGAEKEERPKKGKKRKCKAPRS